MKKKRDENKPAKIFLLILAVIIGIIIIVTVSMSVSKYVESVLDGKDREDFLTVESEVASLAKSFEDQSDNAAAWSGGENCSRASVKYGTSRDANCIVNFSVEQKLENMSHAEDIAETYNETVKLSDVVQSFERNEEYFSDSYRIYNFKIKNAPAKIRCYIAHKIEGAEGGVNMRSSLDCSGDARDAWYGI